MHGVIFQSFRDYLVAEHGRDVVQTVFAGEPEYLLSEAYPDAALIRLIGAAAAAAERDVDEIVYGLGVYTAETTFSRRSGRTGSGSTTRHRGGSVCCYAG